MEEAERLSVAVVGGDPLVVDALGGHLEALGVRAAQVVLVAGSSEAAALDLDGDTALFRLSPERARLGKCDVVFLCAAAPDLARDLHAWARGDNFWLFDLSDGVAEGPWVPPDAGSPTIRAAAPALSVPGSDAFCCAALLAAVEGFDPGPLQVHCFLPASDRGTAGVEELFRQSAAALNLQKGPEAVFGRALAFNLYPELRAEEAPFRAALDGLLGRGVEAVRLCFRAPLFHARALSLLLPVSNPAAACRAAEAELRRRGFKISRGRVPPAPLDRGADEGVWARLAPRGDGFLWGWFVYDELKSGRPAFAARLLGALVGRG